MLTNFLVFIPFPPYPSDANIRLGYLLCQTVANVNVFGLMTLVDLK